MGSRYCSVTEGVSTKAAGNLSAAKDPGALEYWNRPHEQSVSAVNASGQPLACWTCTKLEVWPESHWPGFALRQADVFQSYTA